MIYRSLYRNRNNYHFYKEEFTMFKWLDNPITWRGYFKLCGICSVISTVYCVWLWIKLGLFDPVGLVKKVLNKEDED